MTGEASWWAAGLMGFFGSVHCVVMCGGIAGALGEALPRSGSPRLLLHHLGYSAGRIASYASAGALAGASGLLVADLLGHGGALALRLSCGALLVAAGVWIAGGWAGITRLEALGGPLWRRLAPLSRQLAPADRVWKLGVLGAIWGWLPCGLVYAALGAAATTGSAGAGALWMTVFGLGTLPALLAVGAFSVGLQRIRDGRGARRLAGALLVAFGLWTAIGAALTGHAVPAPGHDPHAHHARAHDRAEDGAAPLSGSLRVPRQLAELDEREAGPSSMAPPREPGRKQSRQGHALDHEVLGIRVSGPSSTGRHLHEQEAEPVTCTWVADWMPEQPPSRRTPAAHDSIGGPRIQGASACGQTGPVPA